MFLHFLKQFLIKRRLKSLIKLKRHFNFPLNANKIDVLMDVKYFNQRIEIEKKIVGLFDKNVIINFLFFDTKLRIGQIAENFFYPEDISLNGKFSDKVKEYVNNKSDFFLSYIDSNHPVVNWFSFHKKSDFKIGFYQTNIRIFDLLINANSDDIENNLNELGRYLKIINSNKK